MAFDESTARPVQQSFDPSTAKPVAKETKKEPSFVDKVGAYSYGLGTGIIGAPGDIESMITPSVEGPLKGHETVFPTTKEIQQIIGARISPEDESYIRAGELTPAVLAGGRLVYNLGKAGISKASDLGNLLLGRKTAAQAERVGTEAATAGTAAERALAGQETEAQRLLKSQAERKQVAEKTAGKEAAKGERSLRELAGVQTLPEAGAFKPIPQTPTEVGNFLRQQAENFVKSIKTQRNEAAKVGFANAKNEAALKQSLGQYVDTSPLVKKLDELIVKGGSTDYKNSLTQLKNDLATTKDFEGLEVIRRKLGDAAFGLPEEGYKAIGQGFSKEMYGSLADQMKKYSSDFEKYLADYARLSKNIEAHGTKVGKGLTETQDAAGMYYAKPAEQVAKDIFSSPEKYKQFVDAVGGNLEIAAAAGRRFFAGQLESAKTPEAVEKILKDSRELLRQPGMSGAKQDIESYLASLRQSGRRTGAAADIVKEVGELDKVAATKLKGVSDAKTLMSDAVNALSSAKPGKAIETFESTVLPKIRAAETKAGIRLLSDQQIEGLRQQVQQLEKISDVTTRARVISGILATYVVGQAGVDKIRRLGGMPGVSE